MRPGWGSPASRTAPWTGPAGLPQGSTSYYHPRKLGLIAAAERLAERLDADCATLKARTADLAAEGRLDEAADAVARDLVRHVEEDRDLLLARFEIALAGGREADLAPVAARLSASATEPVAFLLKLLSRGGAHAPPATALALLDGLAFQSVTGGAPPPTVERVRALLASLSG